MNENQVIKTNFVGYSRSESCCKQNIVFTPILRSLSTSAGVCHKSKQKNNNNYTMVRTYNLSNIKIVNSYYL